jgi:toxin YoeB
MKLVFSTRAWSDYLWWQQHDRKTLNRINQLIKDATRDPYSGIGKPEDLRANLSGYWSRRITEEHRFVYKPTDHGLLIASLRYHYS